MRSLPRFLDALHRGGGDLHEQVVSGEEIAEVGLTFLQSLQDPDTRKRDRPGFSSHEPPQAWNPELESPPPEGHPSEPGPAFRPPDDRSPPTIIVIVELALISEPLVGKLAQRNHQNSEISK